VALYGPRWDWDLAGPVLRLSYGPRRGSLTEGRQSDPRCWCGGWEVNSCRHEFFRRAPVRSGVSTG